MCHTHIVKDSVFFLSFFPMNVPYDGFTFLPHQAEAVAWMVARENSDAEFFRGGILADEMGLGKTWMTIGLLLNEVVPNTLLLVPPALQPQWSEALRKASIPHRIFGKNTWQTVDGSRNLSVAISTYDRASMYSDFLARTETFDRIVCDEGHILRNGERIARVRNIQKLGGERRWILSGTPIQNSYSDFKNLLTFLGMDASQTPNKEVASRVLLRRTVGMVRDYVPAMPTERPVHIVHPVTMPEGSDEEAVFQTLAEDLEHAIETHSRSMIVLERYLRIRQFLAHPDIYVQSMKKKFQDYRRERWYGTASKMSAFEHLMADLKKEPTIVFGTFTGEMDLAEISLKRQGYRVFNIRGGMNDKQREAVTRDSRTLVEAGTPVAVIVQIVVGSAGLNLQHCSRVVFLSSHWNPAVVDQAIARAYRMGQTRRVSVHHFLIASNAAKNVDRLMTTLHQTKRLTALQIDDNLFCDSAADTDSILEDLDAVLPVQM